MKVTYYGYFGPTQNVKTAPIADDTVASLATLFASLPPRRPASTNVVPFPADRGRK